MAILHVLRGLPGAGETTLAAGAERDGTAPRLSPSPLFGRRQGRAGSRATDEEKGASPSSYLRQDHQHTDDCIRELRMGARVRAGWKPALRRGAPETIRAGWKPALRAVSRATGGTLFAGPR